MAGEKKQLKVKIVTPERVTLHDFYDEAYIPTAQGIIGIMPKHTSLVSMLKAGEIRLVKDKKTTALSVSAGFIEVRPNSSLIILAETAEHAEKIDIARAEEARKRAEMMLKEKEKISDVEYAAVQAAIEKESARIRVGRKYRNLPPSAFGQSDSE